MSKEKGKLSNEPITAVNGNQKIEESEIPVDEFSIHKEDENKEIDVKTDKTEYDGLEWETSELLSIEDAKRLSAEKGSKESAEKLSRESTEVGGGSREKLSKECIERPEDFPKTPPKDNLSKELAEKPSADKLSSGNGSIERSKESAEKLYKESNEKLKGSAEKLSKESVESPKPDAKPKKSSVKVRKKRSDEKDGDIQYPLLGYMKEDDLKKVSKEALDKYKKTPTIYGKLSGESTVKPKGSAESTVKPNKSSAELTNNQKNSAESTVKLKTSAESSLKKFIKKHKSRKASTQRSNNRKKKSQEGELLTSELPDDVKIATAKNLKPRRRRSGAGSVTPRKSDSNDGKKTRTVRNDPEWLTNNMNK